MEFGEILEAWIVDIRKDRREICEYFNSKFGFDEWGEQKDEWKWFDPKKLKTHSDKHMTDHHEILQRAIKRGITGNISLEQVVMDQITVLDALSQQGQIKVANGEISINSLGELMRIWEYQHKILGGDKVEIKIGGSGGLSMPPQILTEIVKLMREFIDPRKQAEFRSKLDKELFPRFKEYAEQWEEDSGRDFTRAQLGPGDGEIVVDAEVIDEDTDENQNGSNNGQGS